MATKEQDRVAKIQSAMTHDAVLFFTNLGKVYKLRVWEIPTGTRTSKGKALINLLPLQKKEVVTSILTYQAAESNNKDRFIFMCTHKGIVKKTRLSAFANIKKNGIIAIRLQKDDYLNWAELTDGTKDIIIITHLAKSIHFKESDVRPIGRASKGVIGMRLHKLDYITSMDICVKKDSKHFLFVISENGIGKKSLLKLFPLQKRGGKGVKVANIDERTGKVVFSAIIKETKSTLIITSKKGQVVKIPVKHVPKLSRNAKGVILMRFSKEDKVASATFL